MDGNPPISQHETGGKQEPRKKMSEEDFDVQSLATYLHLTPAQVERMASRNQAETPGAVSSLPEDPSS